MRTLAFAAAFVLLSAAAAYAGDSAVSTSTLDSMGLGRMRQLTDRDGLAVRGKGPFDDLFGAIIPGWPTFMPPTTPDDPPTPHPPQSPFGSWPFGGTSMGGGFPSGVDGSPVGGSTFGFPGGFPWPMQ